MRKLLLTDIIASISIGEEVFTTLRDIEPMYDTYGELMLSAGHDSVVFNVRHCGKRKALKCYYEPSDLRGERCEYASSECDNLLIHPRYFPGELWVNGTMTDVALYPWVEGRTLDWYIRRALHQQSQEQLTTLLFNVIDLCLRILKGEWRHGDFKSDNIIVTPSCEMVMVDCDALYAPTLPPSGECGTPLWTHPTRRANYNSHIDDYAIALMVVSLAALAADRSLFIGECAVAMPSLGNRERIATLLANDKTLSTLHEALYSQTYIINNIEEHLECIAHRLQDSTKPLF